MLTFLALMLICYLSLCVMVLTVEALGDWAWGLGFILCLCTCFGLSSLVGI